MIFAFKVVKFTRRLSRGRKAGALPLLWPLLAIAAIPIFAGAMLITTVFLADFYTENYLDLAVTTPGFDYEIIDGVETGNATFEVYQQMRLMAIIILICVVITGIVLRVLETGYSESDIMSSSIVSTTVTKPVMLIILFFAFPMMWDIGTDLAENTALWIVNPTYSFDPDRPCPDAWYDDERFIIDTHNNSSYTRSDMGARLGLLFYGIEMAENVCKPELRSNYLISQAVRNTEYEEYKPPDPLSFIFRTVINFMIGNLVSMFFAIAKGIVAVNLVMSTILAMIMTDVVAGVAIAAMPLFAIMSMVPKYTKIAEQFLSVLPALLILPILIAITIVVGSSFVANVNQQDIDFIQNPGFINIGLFYTWISAIGVLFLASMLPVIIIGLIGKVVGDATNIIQQSTQAASFMTSMAVKAPIPGAGGSLSSIVGGKLGMGGGGGGGDDGGDGNDSSDSDDQSVSSGRAGGESDSSD